MELSLLKLLLFVAFLLSYWSPNVVCAKDLNLNSLEEGSFSLSIVSKPDKPGNRVFVDGNLAGEAPLTITHLQKGAHMIEVRGKDGEGYQKIVGKVGEQQNIAIFVRRPLITSVFIKGGCFMMGSDKGVAFADEMPVHEVCVSDFFISSTEVTKRLFDQFVQETGYRTDAEKEGHCWGWDGDLNNRAKKNWKYLLFKQAKSHPVVCVSWNDSVIFANWLSKKSGKTYRLPTEAEWEFASRERGRDVIYSGTSSQNELPLFGNYCDDSCDAYSKNAKYSDGYVNTAPVASYKPNGAGVFDMSGNVWEWCLDGYGKDFYKTSPKWNPVGPRSDYTRVLRGGSWLFGFDSQRTRKRSFLKLNFRSSDTGFRVVRKP